MNKLLAIGVLGFLAVFAYQRYHLWSLASQPAEAVETESEAEDESFAPEDSADASPPAESPYRCDGRTHCRQFDSCEEATWFIENCPGMKMDGDNDGIPCEDQLCGH